MDAPVREHLSPWGFVCEGMVAWCDAETDEDFDRATRRVRAAIKTYLRHLGWRAPGGDEGAA